MEGKAEEGTGQREGEQRGGWDKGRESKEGEREGRREREVEVVVVVWPPSNSAHLGLQPLCFSCCTILIPTASPSPPTSADQ